MTVVVGCGKNEALPSTSAATEAGKQDRQVQPEATVRAVDLEADFLLGESDFLLGRRYYLGEGSPRDINKAIGFWQMAAARGHAPSQGMLGWIYSEGEGVPKDSVKAVEWWQKAAANGHANSQAMLGWAYSEGEGVSKDSAKAVEWWQKAAGQGDPEAQLYLGKAYFFGEGVPKDSAKAAEWWQKAAAQGNVGAQLSLGLTYAMGEGVPKDNVLAYAWTILAAARGEEDAEKLAGRLGAALSQGERSEAERIASSWSPGQVLGLERGTSDSSSPQKTAYVDPKTGFSFPQTIAGFAFRGEEIYEDPRLGYSTDYGSEDGINVTVYVYDLGTKGILNGIDNQAVRDQLVQARGDIENHGMYRSTQLIEAPKGFSPYFLSASYRIVKTDGSEHRSHLFLRGQRQHFVKVRATGPAQPEIDARIGRFLEMLSVIIGANDRRVTGGRSATK